MHQSKISDDKICQINLIYDVQRHVFFILKLYSANEVNHRFTDFFTVYVQTRLYTTIN